MQHKEISVNEFLKGIDFDKVDWEQIEKEKKGFDPKQEDGIKEKELGNGLKQVTVSKDGFSKTLLIGSWK